MRLLATVVSVTGLVVGIGFLCCSLTHSLFSVATVEEASCPVGTIRETEGGASVMDCLPCPAGDYCLEASWETTGGCEEGFYCPSPILNPYGNNPPEIGSYGPRQVRGREGRVRGERRGRGERREG